MSENVYEKKPISSDFISLISLLQNYVKQQTL